jgi:hypothetical protein
VKKTPTPGSRPRTESTHSTTTCCGRSAGTTPACGPSTRSVSRRSAS